MPAGEDGDEVSGFGRLGVRPLSPSALQPPARGSTQHGAAGQGCRRTRGPVGGCASSLPPRPSLRSRLTGLRLHCPQEGKSTRSRPRPPRSAAPARCSPVSCLSAQPSRGVARSSRGGVVVLGPRPANLLRSSEGPFISVSRAAQHSNEDGELTYTLSLSRTQARASLSTSSPPRPTSPRAAPAGTTPATPSSPTSTASRPSSTSTSSPRVRLCGLGTSRGGSSDALEPPCLDAGHPQLAHPLLPAQQVSSTPTARPSSATVSSSTSRPSSRSSRR